jgi:hypothetical protein
MTRDHAGALDGRPGKVPLLIDGYGEISAIRQETSSAYTSSESEASTPR